MRFADGRMQFFRREETFGVLGIIAEYVGAEFNFAARLVDPLSHLERHGMRKRLRLLMQQRRCFRDDDRAFGVGLLPPRLEASGRRRKLCFEFGVAQLVELLQKLAGCGIETLIGHD